MLWNTLSVEVVARPRRSSSSLGKDEHLGADIPFGGLRVSPPWPALLERASRERYRLSAFGQEFHSLVSMCANDRSRGHDWGFAFRFYGCYPDPNRFLRTEFSGFL